MTGIADTGFLVAFANRRDTHFPWAFALAEHLSEPLLTCEAVLAEAAYHLRNSGLVLRFVETGLVRLAFEVESHRSELSELARRYADRQPDLADLCLNPHERAEPETSGHHGRWGFPSLSAQPAGNDSADHAA